uniref:FAD linked oxidase N-terminal domain-containing protein n=1 Tax=Oryza meridionalis TaxID=40149 RepID=A0A0E0F3C1_9ORYZ
MAAKAARSKAKTATMAKLSKAPAATARKMTMEPSRVGNFGTKVSGEPWSQAALTSLSSSTTSRWLLLASLCSARWRNDGGGFLWCVARRSPLTAADSSRLVHVPGDASCPSLLNSTVQNLRFASPRTPRPTPPRRGPLAIVDYAYDETAMSPEQELVCRPVGSGFLWCVARRSPPTAALVLTLVTADEVRTCVVCCRAYGLTVRARSGGHDYEGLTYHSLRPSGDGEGAARFAVVDVAALRAVWGVACAEAGATRTVRRVIATGLPPPPPASSPPAGCTAHGKAID